MRKAIEALTIGLAKQINMSALVMYNIQGVLRLAELSWRHPHVDIMEQDDELIIK